MKPSSVRLMAKPSLVSPSSRVISTGISPAAEVYQTRTAFTTPMSTP
uniref:Uncharacterized protein n=1 Tax=Arundo donax TaxID=35708 RepID=A0A0A9ACW7_ARUDO